MIQLKKERMLSALLFRKHVVVICTDEIFKSIREHPYPPYRLRAFDTLIHEELLGMI